MKTFNDVSFSDLAKQAKAAQDHPKHGDGIRAIRGLVYEASAAQDIETLDRTLRKSLGTLTNQTGWLTKDFKQADDLIDSIVQAAREAFVLTEDREDSRRHGIADMAAVKAAQRLNLQ